MFILKNAIIVLIWTECKGCGVQEQCGAAMDCDGPCGYIASPGYPVAAFNEANCRWRIRASHNQVVEIEFLDFDVNYLAEGDTGLDADPRCLHASVSVFTVASETQPLILHIIGRFCNENKPPHSPIVSTTSIMELQYSVNTIAHGNSTRGFLARYRLKDSDPVALDAGNITQGIVVVEF